MATKKTKDSEAVQAIDGMAMLMGPQLRMAEAMLTQQIELLDFLKSRFERDRKMLSDLSRTKDPNTAMSLWGDFWQSAMSDYAMESSKLMASMQGVGEAAISSLKPDDSDGPAPGHHATPV